jgi:hypothetical protein
MEDDLLTHQKFGHFTSSEISIKMTRKTRHDFRNTYTSVLSTSQEAPVQRAHGIDTNWQYSILTICSSGIHSAEHQSSVYICNMNIPK